MKDFDSWNSQKKNINLKPEKFYTNETFGGVRLGQMLDTNKTAQEKILKDLYW